MKRGRGQVCPRCGVPIYCRRGDTLFRHAHADHLLLKPAAWSFYRHTLDGYARRGVAWIVVNDLDSGTAWRASVRQFDVYGVRDVARGAYSGQVALPLRYWSREQTRPARSDRQQADADRQLRLIA